MLDHLSHRLLTVLQLTRMALVFTAISNSWCTLRLAGRGGAGAMILVALVSVGLYGFGMSLNDIIDRRRDRQIAAHRPLPAGRIGVYWAYAVCAAVLGVAMVGGILYSQGIAGGWRSLVLLGWTIVLIAFYDFAGKYLVGAGLLTLGLIRFFHALIPAPGMPLVWHPLLLFTHVALLSAVAYAWEEKRPALTRLHWAGVIAGVALIDVFVVAVVGWRGAEVSLAAGLGLRWGLLIPAGLAGAFVAAAAIIRRRSESSRAAGQTLMLTGLLWLIIYDSAFVAVYVGVQAAALQLLLLPMAYVSVLLMRWWGKVVLLSQAPEFKRVRSGPQIPR